MPNTQAKKNWLTPITIFAIMFAFSTKFRGHQPLLLHTKLMLPREITAFWSKIVWKVDFGGILVILRQKRIFTGLRLRTKNLSTLSNLMRIRNRLRMRPKGIRYNFYCQKIQNKQLTRMSTFGNILIVVWIDFWLRNKESSLAKTNTKLKYKLLPYKSWETQTKTRCIIILSIIGILATKKHSTTT